VKIILALLKVISIFESSNNTNYVTNRIFNLVSNQPTSGIFIAQGLEEVNEQIRTTGGTTLPV
jgi:hypothetical protein